ncbi:MAG: hypothetical protein J6W38_06180 [Prevotella sp.]|nr:hypothetical protein [Prevotella sp.]
MNRVFFLLLFLPQLAWAQYDAKCFSLDATDDIKQVTVRQTISNNTEIPFGVRTPISGLSVSGRVVFKNDDDSYVRVIMKDEYNYEHLVYENYPLLADAMSFDFQNIAMETKQLDRIIPNIVRVELKNATLTLESLNYIGQSDSKTLSYENETFLLKEQSQYIVDRLNKNLAKHKMIWRAGMTSVAEKTYEEKKALFGGEVPQLYGFEYYSGGVFAMPGTLKPVSNTNTKNITSNSYVSEWDWRNRHGKNWMTCVKDQGNCGSCWAHAAVSVVESYVNLYYNRLINPNLSEQEIIACKGIGCHANYENVALKYIRDNGIVNEQCFPYNIPDSMNCWKKCDFPDTLAFINGYMFVDEDTSSIKQALFNNPLTIAIGPWHHSMVIVGYKTIALGDTIYLGNQSGANYVIVDSNHLNYLNKNAWIIKNSWGTQWGNNGYGYIFVKESNIWRVLTPTGNVTCNILNDNDINCEDADGDGLYFWGVGSKPANCPSWVPDEADGDDSNINYGTLDNYGNLALLPEGITIKNTLTYSQNGSMAYRLGIVNGGIYTITGTMTLTGTAKIRVCEGGTLILDGGTLQNADITMVPGCTVILRNNGKINMAPGKLFNAPVGAIVNIKSGEIN